jgi:hypothetical protein
MFYYLLPKSGTYVGRVSFESFYLQKVYFSCKNLTFYDGKVWLSESGSAHWGKNQDPYPRIEANADSQHWIEEQFFSNNFRHLWFVFVTTKSDQNPDPHCFDFLDPDPQWDKKQEPDPRIDAKADPFD